MTADEEATILQALYYFKKALEQLKKLEQALGENEPQRDSAYKVTIKGKRNGK